MQEEGDITKGYARSHFHKKEEKMAGLVVARSPFCFT